MPVRLSRLEALGHGRFALYAHLVPGSLWVAVGARVRRGDTLGSSGLPFVLARFGLSGRVLGLDGPGPPAWPAPAGGYSVGSVEKLG